MEHPFHAYPKNLYADGEKSGELAKMQRIVSSPSGVVVHNKEEEAAARNDGYGDTYIHQGEKFSKADLAAKVGATYDEASDTFEHPKSK